jgi:hypothetical protein
MKSNFEAAKDEFDDLVSKWDKALESDIFKPGPALPSTADQTSINSFFGPMHANPTDQIKDVDAKYWNAIHSASSGVDSPMERIDEVHSLKSIVEDPNPVRKGTEGKDQELTSIGATFSEDDIQGLADMKLKLHDLENKVATMEDKDYSSQIKKLIFKIDELSDKMCGKKIK